MVFIGKISNVEEQFLNGYTLSIYNAVDQSKKQ